MLKVKSARISNRNKPAPLFKRFFAYIIDLLVVNLVVSLPLKEYLTKFSDNAISILLGTNDSSLMWLSIFITFMILLYFTLLEYLIGQTLGKMLLNINVVSLVGNKLTLYQAFLRNLVKPFPIVLLVDVLYMFFRRGNQRLFEVFSATMVVEKELIVK